MIKKNWSNGFILLTLLLTIQGTAQKNYKPGNSYFDIEKWTELRVGNMPLVISVPHGGLMKPDSLADRDCADAITVVDSYTIELANAIDSVFKADYGYRPTLVICYLARKKIDQNRELTVATCGNTTLAKTWAIFHSYINDALTLANEKYGKCAYIDLHAQGHPIQRLELGYLLTPKALMNFDTQKNIGSLAQKSSLQNLLNINPALSFAELLVGANSFGTWMANNGFPSIPSNQDPYPNNGEKYFDGGYNTRRYTSAQYPTTFGWQIETNFKGVREVFSRPLFAKAFCKNIVRYLQEYADIKLTKIN